MKLLVVIGVCIATVVGQGDTRKPSTVKSAATPGESTQQDAAGFLASNDPDILGLEIILSIFDDVLSSADEIFSDELDLPLSATEPTTSIQPSTVSGSTRSLEQGTPPGPADSSSKKAMSTTPAPSAGR